MHLILASGSPRRKELLSILEIPFEIIVSEVKEDFSEKNPVLLTENLSGQKASAVFELLERDSKYKEDFCVIGADTIVFAGAEPGNYEIYGKPSDRADAKRMIQSLQGVSHTVCTGVTLLYKKDGEKSTLSFSEQTKVYVAGMTENEIENYLDSGEPYDKAGAYGIQGLFSKFIEKIEGDYYNVVGLPVHKLYQTLQAIL